MRMKLLAVLAVAIATAMLVGRGVESSTASATRKSRPSVTLAGAAVQGTIAKVRPRIRGWRAGARWRIFVDGRYNNFSTSRRLGLALNLRPGVHRVTADVIAGGRRSRRSHARRIVVKASSDPTIAAVGDIACDPADPAFRNTLGVPTACRGREVASLIAGARPRQLLALGDIQYECGGVSAYAKSYNRIFGRFKAITRPIPGNHDYKELEQRTFKPTCDGTSGQGYYNYFGAAAAGVNGNGYYSYDVGSWHVVALNSECDHVPGGCGFGSPEELWLRADLAAHPTACSLVYWHEPRWSGRVPPPGHNPTTDAFWRDAAAAGVDVVLVGHHHLYERLTPLDANGVASPTGIRQFTVGTGGRNLFGGPIGWLPISQSHQHTVFGALLLRLGGSGYAWQFVPQHGAVFTDYGTSACH
jgi:hypothetical protein